MIKSILVVIQITIISITLYGQGSVKYIDQLNGYRRFKFSDSPQKHLAFIKESSLPEFNAYKSKRVKEYNSFEKEFLFFGDEFHMITLFFIDNKLFEISLFASHTSEDIKLRNDLGFKPFYAKILDEVYKLFGEATTSKQEEDLLGNYFFAYWETQTNKVEVNTKLLVNGTMYTHLIFYNKELLQQAELSKYK